MNCTGVSSVLKSGVEEILSSRVCRNTFWKSSISGRLPNKLSIWKEMTSGRVILQSSSSKMVRKVQKKPHAKPFVLIKKGGGFFMGSLDS